MPQVVEPDGALVTPQERDDYAVSGFLQVLTVLLLFGLWLKL